MTTPARTTLTAALKTALEASTPDNGARLWLGRKVLIGMPQLNQLEVPCIALWPGDETPDTDAHYLGHVQILYLVTGYVNRLDTTIDEYTADPHADWALIDGIIADLRTAVENWCNLSDVATAITYQGARPLYPEDGGETVGAELRYLITTPYIEFIPGN